jgi:Zn-dependent peptidase ImmA (M78 family)/transcriptional regulator with XRE-family HTH domain
MSARTHIKISPNVLKWARESSGLGEEVAAKRIGLKREKLKKWEDEEATPTPRQLEKAADVYKRPVASFFLEKPPAEPPLPVDFRSLRPEQSNFSPKVRFAIRRARWLGTSYVEIATQLGVVPTPIPEIRGENPERIAAVMREVLSASTIRIRGKQPSEALALWRGVLEAKGILVFQFSIPVEEARALSMVETFPIILLSSKDSYAARVFSLFHELAHILLRRPGLCIPEIGRPRPSSLDIERLCNSAAGLALVPSYELLNSAMASSVRKGGDVHDALEPLARHFGVSRQVILRRFVDVGIISWATFAQVMDVLRAEFEAQEERKKKRAIVVPPSVKTVSQLGKKLLSEAFEARAKGILTDSELSELFGLKLQHVPDVQAMVEAE